jgi:hypothetical protein
MTPDTVKALTDSELVQVIAWAQAETKARTERRKQETIAKIKAMAAEVGVSVAIQGGRGRPAKGRATRAKQ